MVQIPTTWASTGRLYNSKRTPLSQKQPQMIRCTSQFPEHSSDNLNVQLIGSSKWHPFFLHCSCSFIQLKYFLLDIKQHSFYARSCIVLYICLFNSMHFRYRVQYIFKLLSFCRRTSSLFTIILYFEHRKMVRPIHIYFHQIVNIRKVFKFTIHFKSKHIQTATGIKVNSYQSKTRLFKTLSHNILTSGLI